MKNRQVYQLWASIVLSVVGLLYRVIIVLSVVGLLYRVVIVLSVVGLLRRVVIVLSVVGLLSRVRDWYQYWYNLCKAGLNEQCKSTLSIYTSNTGTKYHTHLIWPQSHISLISIYIPNIYLSYTSPKSVVSLIPVPDWY
jgi:hypothetical protein